MKDILIEFLLWIVKFVGIALAVLGLVLAFVTNPLIGLAVFIIMAAAVATLIDNYY